MLIIPAVDIKDGKVVRLNQGRFEEIKVYSDDPVQTAIEWQRQGAERLHIVDLDGARTGRLENIDILRRIVEGTDIFVQFGGGLRARTDIVTVLNMGVRWVVLGTRAYEDLEFVEELLAEFGEQIIISIDVRFRKIATRGWTETVEIEDVDLIKRLRAIGVKCFIYTDISRDGTLSGFNKEAVKNVLDETGVCMFYSGGISTLEDIKDILSLGNRGLAGVIIGKALYEGRINLAEAMRLKDEKI